MSQTLLRPFAIVTSPFGERPQWRIDMGLGAHRGVDFDCDLGDPIPASGVGVCTAEGWSDALGWWVVVRYSTAFGDIYFGYCHMQYRTHLRYGVWVKQGERVGFAGNTGSATTGVHLHMTASWQNGNPGYVPVVDPMQFIPSAAVAGLDIIEITNTEDTEMTIAFIPDAQSATIRVLNTDTGKYAGIGSPYHMTLINRVVKNRGGDKMLLAELDIVANYLRVISEDDVNVGAILAAIDAVTISPEAIVAEIKQGLTIDPSLSEAEIASLAETLVVALDKSAVTVEAIVDAVKGAIHDGVTVDATLPDEEIKSAADRIAKLIGIRLAGGDIAGS